MTTNAGPVLPQSVVVVVVPTPSSAIVLSTRAFVSRAAFPDGRTMDAIGIEVG